MAHIAGFDSADRHIIDPWSSTVTWNDAVAFCKWARTASGPRNCACTSWAARNKCDVCCPTEAQYEYAWPRRHPNADFSSAMGRGDWPSPVNGSDAKRHGTAVSPLDPSTHGDDTVTRFTQPPHVGQVRAAPVERYDMTSRLAMVRGLLRRGITIIATKSRKQCCVGHDVG